MLVGDKKPKIFIGLVNIASQINDLKIGFEELGYECLTAIKGGEYKIITDDVDYDFSKMKKWSLGGKPKHRVWREAVKTCDVFIFIFSSFKPKYRDLAYLKKKGKTVISIFVGSDIRWGHACRQEFRHYGLKEPDFGHESDKSIKRLSKKLTALRLAERYSDFIFSRLDQSQLSLRPYYKWDMMVQYDKFPCTGSQNRGNPIVVHAPSRRSVKGTKHVLDVFNRLKDEGVDFTPKLIENMEHSEALKQYQECDVLIDQLYLPGTGKVSTEALASGSIAMSLMAYGKYPQLIPSDCPIIDVNPDSLYQELKSLLLDYDRRSEIGSKGKAYVEENLDVSSFCRKVDQLISGENLPCDYNPSFFREHFVPESKQAEKLYNKWTKSLITCDWYREGISGGNREGLLF